MKSMQAAVEAHAAIPDLEQQQRVVQEIAQRVEQHVADAPAQHHAEHGVEQQVGEAVGIDARQAPVGNALAAQQPGRGEAEQVHDAVPVHLDRPQREGDGVDVVEIDHGRCLAVERLFSGQCRPGSTKELRGVGQAVIV
ncbi:hypothetical protein G6F68_014642 [Rhizopus microsporus]|nr:hypothetical protein G6F68_014642 [Rhizopus microsporus]